MRATQKFIDEQFDSLLVKIGNMNEDLLESIRKHDPELQYKILRQIDKFDDKLFYVAISTGTDKWLENVIDRIDWPDQFPMTFTSYKLAGFSEEEVDTIYNNRLSHDSLHEEVVKTNQAIMSKLKDIKSSVVDLAKKPMSKKTKNALRYGLAVTSACILGVILGKVTD